MNQHDHIVDALEIVLASNIPDEDFTQIVNDQARLMACVNPDDLGEDQTDIH
jgi:hypothetical protein